MLNPTTSLEQAEQKLLLSIGVSCLLGGVVALLICLWVSRWLTHHIQTLTDAAEQLADGDFATRIIVIAKMKLGSWHRASTLWQNN